MGKVVAIAHLTLDGVMQSPARPDEDRRGGFAYGGWASVAGADPALQGALGAHMGPAWSLLLGRITYEDFAQVWPNAPQPNPFTEALNSATKYVASTTLREPLPWQNSILLTGNVADAVAKLKQDQDKTLVIFGSGVLVQSLLQRRLIDEFVLQIHPVTLGAGMRLFAYGAPFTQFRLTDTVATESGVIVASYQLV